MTARLYGITALLVALAAGGWWIKHTFDKNAEMKRSIAELSDTINGQKVAILAQADAAVLTSELNAQLRQRGAAIDRQRRAAETKLKEMPKNEQQATCDDTPLPAGYLDGLRELADQLRAGDDNARP